MPNNNVKNTVKGLVGQRNIADPNETNLGEGNVNVQGKTGANQEANSQSTNDNLSETPKKSTRGRKKKTTEVALDFKGKGLKIRNLKVETNKVNKTFYIEERYIDILEDFSRKTGMSTSELVQVAIKLLENNTELEGFEE